MCKRYPSDRQAMQLSACQIASESVSCGFNPGESVGIKWVEHSVQRDITKHIGVTRSNLFPLLSREDVSVEIDIVLVEPPVLKSVDQIQQGGLAKSRQLAL